MRNVLKTAIFCVSAVVGVLLSPRNTSAEDIDIFVHQSSNSAGNPNVLIVLDNTPNWARQSQQWPGGEQQGQSEVAAIKQVIQGLDSSVNVGLMEFVTGGNANDDGGYIRFPVVPMSTDNKAALATQLDTIYANINSPNEKTNGSRAYGDLMYDVYNYFAGANSYSPNGVIGSLTTNATDASGATTNGYTTNYTKFKAPLSSASTCGKTFIIFIGNTRAAGPMSDAAANTAALAALGGDTTQLRLPEFQQQTVLSTSTTIGNTTGCYADANAAKTASGWGLNINDNLCELYNALGTQTTASVTDSASQTCAQYSVSGTSLATDTAAQAACTSNTSGYTNGCSIGSAIPNISVSTTGVTGYYDTAPAATSAAAGTLATYSSGYQYTGQTNLSCPVDAISCSYSVVEKDTFPTGQTTLPAATAWTGTSNSCYKANNANLQWSDTLGDYGTPTCPTGYTAAAGTCTQVCPAGKTCGTSYLVGTGTNPTPYCPSGGYTCTYTSSGYVDANTCGSGYKRATITQVLTAKKSYTVTRNMVLPGSAGTCPVNTNKYNIVANTINYATVATSNTFADTGPRNADEWANFMFKNGIPVSGSTIRPSVTTYTIDVYNKQPNAVQTSLLLNMAKVGGGKYYTAQNKQMIVDALKNIMIEIYASNTAFASSSLPVNASNRTQNENQVFIGMFRPDQNAKPRWFGNLKRYQIVDLGAGPTLGDVNRKQAINFKTGFITDCAISYWTTDLGAYWSSVTDGAATPQLLGVDTVKGADCSTRGSYTNAAYSDYPDGPLVQKGGVAEVIRAGNSSATSSTATWAVNRNVYTVTSGQAAGSALAAFNVANTGLSSSLVNFMLGKDVNNERADGQTDKTRPSLHGDVIHSRPLPINYGGTTKIVVYYGANDGTLRAVDSDTGVEKWAFVAPEFFSSLSRLSADSPLVSYPPTPVTGSSKKDYYFDGSTGFYQSADNTKVWIYPSMRRGGRMIYGLDVTTPDSPKFKWKAGCPNLTDDTGCADGTGSNSTTMSKIGQTWSTPRGVRIKGYTAGPVVIFGGGYDSCEDTDAVSPTCTNAKGGAVFILDASTGALVKSFTTAGRVASDIALLDINGDGYADYAYAADTTGNIYRIDFVAGPTSLAGLGRDDWTSYLVAYTTGGNRKFLFEPALFYSDSKVYLAVGSGDREHPLDSNYPYTTPVTNRFYVYLDSLAVKPATTADAFNLDSGANYTSSTSCTTAAVLPSGTLKGWYMNLTQYGKGEQTVTSALIANGLVAFSTNRPLPASDNSCSNTLGEARGYLVSLFNASGGIGVDGICGGTRSGIFEGGGLPPSPVLARSVPVTDNNGATHYVTITVGVVDPSGTGANAPGEAKKVRIGVDTKRKRVYKYLKTEN